MRERLRDPMQRRSVSDLFSYLMVAKPNQPRSVPDPSVVIRLEWVLGLHRGAHKSLRLGCRIFIHANREINSDLEHAQV